MVKTQNVDDRSDTLLRAQAIRDYKAGRVSDGMRDVYYEEYGRLYAKDESIEGKWNEYCGV